MIRFPSITLSLCKIPKSLVENDAQDVEVVSKGDADRFFDIEVYVTCFEMRVNGFG